MTRDDDVVVRPVRMQLGPEVPLSVHLVTGDDFAVLIDSGVAGMFGLIRDLITTAMSSPTQVRLILNTHSHHDHIGGNARLAELTGALVGAPAGHRAWHTDLDRHYREFARGYPGIIDDTPAERAEFLATIDGPRRVDVTVCDGQVIDLGGGVELEAVALPGHMPDEIGFVERQTRTLLIGDALTGVGWSFFHGYYDADVYEGTLTKLRSLIRDQRIRTVRAAHYEAMPAAEALAVLDRIAAEMSSVESIIREAGREERAFGLRGMWQTVSDRLSKAPEFRGLSVVAAHLRRLERLGEVRALPSGEFQWTGSAGSDTK